MWKDSVNLKTKEPSHFGPMCAQGFIGVQLAHPTQPSEGVDDHLLEDAAHDGPEEHNLHNLWGEVAHETSSLDLGRLLAKK